ncbi:hypothetical protein NDU88_003652 [Pleurodeles waltl]|uniref:Uncharacterized protein n=1 Tax=Pleurodeles waltl TaxID=8319 RepID=A0AAV7SGK3_PLEWA|nr:hypothetical protein NDU88_003652 [Pleurodeles waltl]
MRILIRHTDKKVTKLLGDIETLETEIGEVTRKDLVKKNYEILDKVNDDCQMYLRDKKQQKVKRDDLDYKLEMEQLRQGTKSIRQDTRQEGVGNDGNKDTGKSGVRTRSKKD